MCNRSHTKEGSSQCGQASLSSSVLSRLSQRSGCHSRLGNSIGQCPSFVTTASTHQQLSERCLTRNMSTRSEVSSCSNALRRSHHHRWLPEQGSCWAPGQKPRAAAAAAVPRWRPAAPEPKLLAGLINLSQLSPSDQGAAATTASQPARGEFLLSLSRFGARLQPSPVCWNGMSGSWRPRPLGFDTSASPPPPVPPYHPPPAQRRNRQPPICLISPTCGCCCTHAALACHPLTRSWPTKQAPSSQTAMKFELDDDAVLRLSGVASAAYGATLLLVPRTSHDTFYVAQARAGEGCGWGGLASAAGKGWGGVRLGRLARAAAGGPAVHAGGLRRACQSNGPVWDENLIAVHLKFPAASTACRASRRLLSPLRLPSLPACVDAAPADRLHSQRTTSSCLPSTTSAAFASSHLTSAVDCRVCLQTGSIASDEHVATSRW